MVQDLINSFEEDISLESFLELPSSKNKLKDFLRHLPKSPGVYTFLDHHRNPIYIGKAKSLKSRLSSYFGESSEKTKKLQKLLNSLKGIQLLITNSELESLIMEQYLIKQIKPKFNVQFKDDKGYPWIRIETSKEFPSAKSYLGKKESNEKYFGPFPSSFAVQDSLKLLQKTFKLRNCSDSFFKNRTRPCIQYEIGRCSAPCVGLISKEDYMLDVNSTELLLSGRSEKLISGFYQLMDKYSKNKSFEKAAIYRDKISSLRDVQRLQSISGYSKDRDAISVCSVNGQTKIGITHVSEGWITGHENFIQNNIILEGSAIEYFIQAHYLTVINCPSRLVIAEKINNKKIIEEALSEFHNKSIKIITKLGRRDQGLMKICQDNTKFSFNKEGVKKKAIPILKLLQEELNLKKKIQFIESYDISHHSGSAAVAGCVVYSEKGKLKEKYRLFNISEANSGDDIASMVEVFERRFAKDSIDLKLPNLIILDGGKTHLSYVISKLKQLKIKTSVIAISKGSRRKADMDLIHREDGTTKRVSNGSSTHKFIQEIRDETHRFTIATQKKKLKKTFISSSLDSLEGIGPQRKKILLRYFGSLDQIKRASSEDFINVPGIGKKTANLIYNQLK
ncbi:MAG: hypothetical protein CMG57_09045 [Candidatus Marinimicrobia bacterium]|nr:hypothetical protein [Candidatus Neomarinimicrobiota bacterium]|tara:strand:- start:1828 stop:3690 length:1863 start_codon:yes stop_codon:yes gene_type:complete